MTGFVMTDNSKTFCQDSYYEAFALQALQRNVGVHNNKCEKC